MIARNRDMVAVAIVALLVSTLLPSDSWAARPDLAAFSTMVLSVCAALRGDRLGLGPHPMLLERQSRLFSGAMGRIALALVPPVMLVARDAGAGIGPYWMPIVGALVGCLALAIWHSERRTAWNPPGRPDWLVLIVGTSLVVGGAAMLGKAEAAISLAVPKGDLPSWQVLRESSWVTLSWGTTVSAAVSLSARATLLGAQFLAIALAAGHPRNLRQRIHASGAGRMVGRVSFRHVLAGLGPTLAYGGHGVCFAFAFGRLPSLSEAYVVCLLVPVWCGLLWAAPVPEWVACLWHEVVPRSGMDKVPDGVALAFDTPPTGALRFTPLSVRRTRTIHPWFVPVQQARIGRHDDPVERLWEPPQPFPGAHVLGDASFIPRNGTVQTDQITLRLSSRSDSMVLTQDDAQAARIVILRAFPKSRRRALRAYRWERPQSEGAVQVLDASCSEASLRDGDVIVLSSEGVARAFELELGQSFVSGPARPWRAPQLMDYVEVKG